MKILITGSNGFIGKNLVDKLLPQNYKILGVDNEFTSITSPKQKTKYTLLHKHIADINNDDLNNVDVLIHLAAVKKHSVLDATGEKELFNTNFLGTHKLFNLAAANGVKKIIYASSLYAHGAMQKLLANESDYPRPLTLYGQSKLFGENVLEEVCAHAGIRGVAIRLYFIYGPQQYYGKGYPSVFISTMQSLLHGLSPKIHNDGLQSLDYLNVDDLCNLISDVIKFDSGNKYELMNASTGCAFQIQYIVETITEIWNRKYGTR